MQTELFECSEQWICSTKQLYSNYDLKNVQEFKQKDYEDTQYCRQSVNKKLQKSIKQTNKTQRALRPLQTRTCGAREFEKNSAEHCKLAQSIDIVSFKPTLRNNMKNAELNRVSIQAVWELQVKSWEAIWKMQSRCYCLRKNSEDTAPRAVCLTQQESAVEQFGKIELIGSEEESEFNSHLMYAYIQL